MDIYREIPEAEKPEKAWIENDMLKVDYHLYDKTLYHYVDAHHDIPLIHIITYTMFFGARKGFKKMEIYFRQEKDRKLTLFSLSRRHEELALSIYNLLKEKNIKPRREIVSG